MNSNNIICNKSNTDDILMESLIRFYKDSGNAEQLKSILSPESKLSLRIIDWFVTNYSKKNNICYYIKNDEGKAVEKFIVYMNYKQQLKGYNKRRFDPFCRRNRIEFYFDSDEYIKTTIGQLNFFRWAIENKVIDYISKHVKDIEKDMNESYKNNYQYSKNKKTKQTVSTTIAPKQRKKREELSVNASKSLNRHNISVIVSFE